MTARRQCSTEHFATLSLDDASVSRSDAADQDTLKPERTSAGAVAKAEHGGPSKESSAMNRVLPAAVSAIALIAASTQLSFAQQPPESDSGWQQSSRQPGPPHPPPPPSMRPPVAKFVFRRGSASITCPQTVSLQDCVHAATELANNLSRIRAAERGNRASSGGDNNRGNRPSSGDRGNRPSSGGDNSDGDNGGE